MADDEIFDSSARAAGDLAGVFEYDGDTGYFYLYETDASEGRKVVDSIHVLSGKTDLTDTDVSIRWDREEQKVGLFIRDVLWAVFDHRRRVKYGGSYRRGAEPTLPLEARRGLVET
jgi:hypothetical protein